MQHGGHTADTGHGSTASTGGKTKPPKTPADKVKSISYGGIRATIVIHADGSTDYSAGGYSGHSLSPKQMEDSSNAIADFLGINDCRRVDIPKCALAVAAIVPPIRVAKVLSLLGKGDRLAATTAERVTVNGETSATKLGRDMHASWDYGRGFEKEFRLPSGKRVDGINFETREIVELKPNNPRQIRLGQRQVDAYVDELNQAYPGDTPWTGSVVTYGGP